MCLILLALGQSEQFPLFVAANRDEFYQRPTTRMAWWEDEPDVLGGKDLLAGGSWMGVHRSGRMAMITNYRQIGTDVVGRPSRGQLVRDFLVSGIEEDAFLERLQAEGQAYNGFNLLFGTPASLWYYSNRGGTHGPLEPGIYGLSNHLLNTPWPKVRNGMALLETAFSEDLNAGPDGTDPGVLLEQRLFAYLDDGSQAADDQLPSTGLPLERERVMSAACIISPDYGTRTSTVLSVDQSGVFKVRERGKVPANGDILFTFQSEV